MPTAPATSAALPPGLAPPEPRTAARGHISLTSVKLGSGRSIEAFPPNTSRRSPDRRLHQRNTRSDYSHGPSDGVTSIGRKSWRVTRLVPEQFPPMPDAGRIVKPAGTIDPKIARSARGDRAVSPWATSPTGIPSGVMPPPSDHVWRPSDGSCRRTGRPAGHEPSSIIWTIDLKMVTRCMPAHQQPPLNETAPVAPWGEQCR